MLKSGPQKRMICAFDGSSMLTVLRRLCGHDSGAPRVLRDQSISRIRAPISPPPARNVSFEGSIDRFFIAPISYQGAVQRHRNPALVRHGATTDVAGAVR